MPHNLLLSPCGSAALSARGRRLPTRARQCLARQLRAGTNNRPAWDFLGLFTPPEPEDKARDAASKLEDAGKEAGKDAKKAVQRPLEQAQDTWQQSKASAESGAENAGQDLQEWGEDTSSKPDPLGAVAWLARPGDQAAHAQLWCAGYFMMGLVLLGLLGLTTTLFKAAGAWRVSHRKETPHRQDRAAVSEPDAGGESRSAGESAERNEHAEADAAIRNLTEAEDQGFNKGEVEGLKDMGDQHLLRLSESPGDTLPPHSLEAMLEQQPEGEDREEGHRVYLPGQGWTTISEEEGYRAISAPGASEGQQAQQRGKEAAQQPQQGSSKRQGGEQADTAMREPQPSESTGAAGQPGAASQQQQNPGEDSVQRPQQPQQGQPEVSQAQPQGRASRQPPEQQASQQPGQSSEHSLQEDEDDEDRDFHRWQQYRPAEAAAVQLTDKELPEHRIPPEQVKLEGGSSASALRQRADVAGQAAVAASEASQRAAAHATAAASSATQASLHAERAHAAAHRARSAAAEGFTRQVEVSERKAQAATEAARQAEQRAASSSGHSAAFREVGSSQADISDKAAAAQPAQSTSAQHRGRLHAVRSNVQGTAQRTWSAGTTRLSRMGHALQLDRFNFGRTWQAVFQALSDAWERVWAAVLSAWHWVRDSAQGLGSRLRTTAQTKAQASSS